VLQLEFFIMDFINKGKWDLCILHASSMYNMRGCVNYIKLPSGST